MKHHRPASLVIAPLLCQVPLHHALHELVHLHGKSGARGRAKTAHGIGALHRRAHRDDAVLALVRPERRGEPGGCTPEDIAPSRMEGSQSPNDAPATSYQAVSTFTRTPYVGASWGGAPLEQATESDAAIPAITSATGTVRLRILPSSESRCYGVAGAPMSEGAQAPLARRSASNSWSACV